MASEVPSTWAQTGNGLAKHCLPVYVETKPGANPVKVCQYPLPLEANKGITPHIRRLLDLGVLRPVQSAWKTPLLPVKKPHANDSRMIQDLWEVNKRVVIDIHPIVPNPYNLLIAPRPKRSLVPQSQQYFAFE